MEGNGSTNPIICKIAQGAIGKNQNPVASIQGDGLFTNSGQHQFGVSRQPLDVGGLETVKLPLASHTDSSSSTRGDRKKSALLGNSCNALIHVGGNCALIRVGG